MQSPAIKQALGILKQLRQIMETPESVPDKLSRILQTIAAKMRPPVTWALTTIIWSFLPHTVSNRLRPTVCACAITKAWPARWRKAKGRL